MKYVVIYISTFTLIFLLLYIFQFIRNEKKNKLGEDKAFYFITQRYHLKMNKERVRILSKIIVANNSFIISIPVFLCLVLNIKYVYLLLISLVLFIVLILLSYNLIGKLLKKKGW